MTASGQLPPAATTIQVQIDRLVKKVDRAASGSLYGLAEPGRPPEALLGGIRPKNFTQMAPGGGQLPNGEIAPTGDALVVAEVAQRHGASVTVRLPDIYPDFPYRWVSWPDWLSRVSVVIRTLREAGTSNVYAYELWNEPNWTWQPQEAGSFDDGWARTCQHIRELDPGAAVLGPSIDRWDRAWMLQFLKSAIAQGCVPDVVSWHELDPADTAVDEHVAEYRRMEADLGLTPRPISINEYGAHRDIAVPGALAAWIGRLERAGVDTANLAFWHQPGRLGGLVTAQGRPTGGWWVFAWYAQMSGQMVAASIRPGEIRTSTVTKPDGARGDVFASTDGDSVHLVFGNVAGDARVVVNGLSSQSQLGEGPRMWVSVERVEWTGTDGALDAPDLWFAEWVPLRDGTVVLPLRDLDRRMAYRVVLTGQSRQSEGIGARTEAEDAVTVGEVDVDVAASTGSFVRACPDGQLMLSIPAGRWPAGPVDLYVRYRNHSGRACTAEMIVAGAVRSSIRLPATPGEGFATAHAVVVVPQADKRIGFRVMDGRLDIDHLDVAAFRVRLEAEDGMVTRGSVQRVDMRPSAFRANTFSGDGFVNWLNEIDSAVDLQVDAPVDGEYVLTIGYANGSGRLAYQELSIDGGSRTMVAYPPTQGWELIGTVDVDVTLAAGQRHVRLGNAGQTAGHVALDYVDLWHRPGDTHLLT